MHGSRESKASRSLSTSTTVEQIENVDAVKRHAQGYAILSHEIPCVLLLLLQENKGVVRTFESDSIELRGAQSMC